MTPRILNVEENTGKKDFTAKNVDKS